MTGNKAADRLINAGVFCFIEPFLKLRANDLRVFSQTLGCASRKRARLDKCALLLIFERFACWTPEQAKLVELPHEFHQLRGVGQFDGGSDLLN